LVTCTADGFGLLTREAILARGEAKTCAIRLIEAQTAAQNRNDLLLSCEAQLASIPPCPPPPGLKKPLTAYAVGVVSAVLLVGGVALPAPDAVRYALSGVGLAGVAAGVVVLVW
jgi:hypothetical protein